MRSFTTYLLEDGYLSPIPIVIGLDILAIIAVDIRQL